MEKFKLIMRVLLSPFVAIGYSIILIGGMVIIPFITLLSFMSLANIVLLLFGLLKPDNEIDVVDFMECLAGFTLPIWLVPYGVFLFVKEGKFID